MNYSQTSPSLRFKAIYVEPEREGKKFSHRITVVDNGNDKVFFGTPIEEEPYEVGNYPAGLLTSKRRIDAAWQKFLPFAQRASVPTKLAELLTTQRGEFGKERNELFLLIGELLEPISFSRGEAAQVASRFASKVTRKIRESEGMHRQASVELGSSYRADLMPSPFTEVKLSALAGQPNAMVIDLTA